MDVSCGQIFVTKKKKKKGVYVLKVLIQGGELVSNFQFLFYVFFGLSKTCPMRIYLTLAQTNKYKHKYVNK